MISITSSLANKVYTNDGTGNYTDSGQALGAAGSQRIVLGDIDNDGDIDIAVANASPLDDKVWLNNGAGIFTDSGQLSGRI